MRRAFVVTVCVALLVGVVWSATASRRGPSDAPYVPVDDAVILSSLPPSVPRSARAANGGAAGAGEGELARWRKELERDPGNLPLATQLAKRNIEEGRARSDPRYLGRAQAALAPWWNEASPPADVLLLRATIRQSTHEFDAALADLDQLLQREPDDAQAWLTRSIVLSVRGDYAESRASCVRLRGLANQLVSAQCVAAVESLSGHAKEAYANLLSAFQRANPLGFAERAWILSSLGEIAIRAGDDVSGERHYRAALDADPSDGYTRAAYADLLIDEGRAAEAIPWLRDRENDDNLLLRLTIAETDAHSEGATAHVQTLRARYLASQERGDVVHRREQARFQLGLVHDAKSALELAKANWQVQREPADARIFLEAALAAQRPNEATPVLEFLEASGAEEPRLAALAARVRQGR